jgi:hypothetical protein
MTPYSTARLSASFFENNWTNRFIRPSPRNCVPRVSADMVAKAG